MNMGKRAVEVFSDGLNCSQAITSSFGHDMGLDEKLAIAIGLPFGGGMGRSGRTCGAVTGALMILGLHCAAMDACDADRTQATHAMARDFIGRFVAQNKASDCRALLGCYISTTEERQQAADKDLFTTICPGLVRSAATILQSMIEENVDDRKTQ